MRTISGDEARALIESQLAAHGNGVLSVLAQYQCEDAAAAWHETVRAVEEFINLPKFGVSDDRLRAWLCAIRLDGAFVSNPGPTWLAVRRALGPHLEPSVIARFTRIVLYAGAMGEAFAAHGHDARSAGITLNTIGGAVDYFQSRRRHLVSLLCTMPYACSGSLVLQPYDALTVLLPQVEHSCIAITGFHQKLALLEALPNFTLEVDSIGAVASDGFETLDDYFLEPERASIHVMAELRGDQFTMPAMEPVDSRKIFSAAELRNGVKLIGATYEAFGLKDSDFSAMGMLVIAFARYSRDDYYVEIEKEKFRSMLRAQGELDPAELETLLVNTPSDYATNTNAYQPFLDLGDRVVSNVNLLSRFLYAFKNVHLGSRRRFQIHAGFIFEDMVKRDLERMGFAVTDIKRINRKEFDVVATHGGTIFNIQCKNNWIDLSKIEAERKLFVRYNRSLTNYYSRALKKERSREHLLKQELGMDKVVHYVVSRFPVIGADPAVINYNQIERLRPARQVGA
jgi:Holliday junction resolvase